MSVQILDWKNLICREDLIWFFLYAVMVIRQVGGWDKQPAWEEEKAFAFVKFYESQPLALMQLSLD